MSASERIGTLYTPSAQGLSPRGIKAGTAKFGATAPKEAMPKSARGAPPVRAERSAAGPSAAIQSAVLNANAPPMTSRWGAYSDGMDTSAGHSLPLEWFDQTEVRVRLMRLAVWVQ